MTVLSKLAGFCRNVLQRNRVERDLEDEMAQFVGDLSAEQERRGASPQDARRAALAEIGSVAAVKDDVRDVRMGARLETLIRDIRIALRGLRSTPGFAAAVIVTLALGIGANTAIFSLVDGVLLRQLPFENADRLVSVIETRVGRGESANISGHEYVAWRDRSTMFGGMALWTYGGYNLTGDGEPEAIRALQVSGNFFTLLGVQPVRGRSFSNTDDAPGAPNVVILSHRLWSRRYAASDVIAGTTILNLDGVPFAVIGVMPSLDGLEPDLWTPLIVREEATRVGRHSAQVIGRLKPNVSMTDAETDLKRVSTQLSTELPAFNTGHSVRLASLAEDILGDARTPLVAALGAVALVLLIACVNVAHLQLTRAASRHRELTVRSALGASRQRLLAQMLTESLVLSLIGGGLGLVLAVWLVNLIPTIEAIDLPRLQGVAINLRTLIVTMGLTVFAAVAGGLLPAIRGSRPQLSSTLAGGTRGSTAVGHRLAGAFVISEIALAAVLLVGAGLLLRSFHRLASTDPGFNADGALTATIALPDARYAGAAERRQAFDEIVTRLSSVPGFTSIGATTSLPLGACCDGNPLTIEGQPAPANGDTPTAMLSVVSDDYFRTMAIPLLRGRYFEKSDARRAVPLIRYYEQQPVPAAFDQPQPIPVAIVSAAMARRHWPDEAAVGRRFKILFSPWITIVGVVDDVKHTGLGDPVVPDVYLASGQEPRSTMTLVMRTDGDPSTLARPVRDVIRAFDPALPLLALEPLDTVVADSVGGPRFTATLLGAFGVVALLLSIVGTYGVIAHGVSQRLHEIGIRTALGGTRAHIVGLILGRAATLTVMGIAIGTVAALVSGRFLEGLLYGVTRTDLVTYVTVPMLLFAVCLCASYLPARRALKLGALLAIRRQ